MEYIGMRKIAGTIILRISLEVCIVSYFYPENESIGFRPEL